MCQNDSNEVFLAWFKFQKFENFKPFRSIRSGRVTKIPPPFPPLCKDKWLMGIPHSISIENQILSVSGVTFSPLVHYDSLLQNATYIITKCNIYYHKMRQLFYYKMRQKFITKCDSYYKLRRFHYKMRQLLKNTTFITNCDTTFNNAIYSLKNISIYLSEIKN